MGTPLTIVMYHYVRPLRGSKYPDIKGLEVECFEGQIQYFRKSYTFVSIEDVIRAVNKAARLPDNAVLLTFDDGYVDHYEHVLPILTRYGIRGAFYPSVQATTEHSLLAQNQIHFILACSRDKDALLQEVFHLLDAYREQFDLRPNQWYYEKLAKPNRFDGADVIFIKRLLQVELDRDARSAIADDLFARVVGVDKKSFARELYMSRDQLRAMLDAGMHVGAHGYRHDWLGSLAPEDQEKDIDSSLRFLDELGAPRDTWTICYPYGDYNESLLTLLSGKGCRLGMTTNFTVADLDRDCPLTLPRLDTNDFPFQADVPASSMKNPLGS